MRRVSKFGPLVALLAILLTGGVVIADVTLMDADSPAELNPARTEATVTISLQCSTAGTMKLTVYVIQTAGRLLNIGTYSDPTFTFDCTGAPTTDSFDIVVPAIEGLKYRPGPATVLVRVADTASLDKVIEKGFTVRLKPNP